MADKDDTRQVFEIMNALAGRSIEGGYQRLLDTPEGGVQTHDRVELSDRLRDRQWLPQTRSAGFGLIAAVVAVQSRRARTRHPCGPAVLQAWRDGRKAARLSGENDEGLLAEPLEAARGRLKIPRPAISERIPPRARNAYQGARG